MSNGVNISHNRDTKDYGQSYQETDNETVKIRSKVGIWSKVGHRVYGQHKTDEKACDNGEKGHITPI